MQQMKFNNTNSNFWRCVFKIHNMNVYERAIGEFHHAVEKLLWYFIVAAAAFFDNILYMQFKSCTLSKCMWKRKRVHAIKCIQSNKQNDNIFICVVDYTRQFSVSLAAAAVVGIVIVIVFIRCYLVSTICAALFFVWFYSMSVCVCVWVNELDPMIYVDIWIYISWRLYAIFWCYSVLFGKESLHTDRTCVCLYKIHTYICTLLW